MIIKNTDFLKFKKPIILSSFIVIWFLLIYFLILTPIFKLLTLKEQIDNLNNMTYKQQNILISLNNNCSILTKKFNNVYSNTQQIQPKSGFADISKFETFIGNLINKNTLKLQSIARYEISNTFNKFYFPYTISGKYQNILNFISDIENSKRDISILKTPFKIEFLNFTIFSGKLATTITNKKAKDIKSLKNLIPISLINHKKIKTISSLKLNNKKYIHIKYYDKTRDIFIENQKIKINYDQYKIKLINNEVYLENN